MMLINVTSKSHCQELIERIRQTMLRVGYNTSRIQKGPSSFKKDDTYILEGLSRAILSRQAEWRSIVAILPSLKSDLCNYSPAAVAAITVTGIRGLYLKYKGKVTARFLEDELVSIRKNALAFLRIAKTHGSVWEFLESNLSQSSFGSAMSCYVRPKDDSLVKSLVSSKSNFKLSGVGLAICCEFFNNVGIDEFKPDVHTKRFFNRVNLNRSVTKLSTKDGDVRDIGLKMADTLGVARKFVDSHIWTFCAEGEAEICTAVAPKCNICLLKRAPQLCVGC